MSHEPIFFDAPFFIASHDDEALVNPAQVVGEHPVLIVPGLNNSDENHWQTLWQNRLPKAQRIAVKNWHEADLDKWRNAIKKSLASINRPSILIAHSFGALAAASIAAEYPELIAAVLLVAPADPDKFQIADRLPERPLAVPVHLIASSNDPWMKDSKAAYWALLWGANFLRVKELGHINSHSNIGVWPQGLKQLELLVRRIKPKNAVNKQLARSGHRNGVAA
jgi:uncharacterized protein